MKKAVAILLCALTALALFPVTVYADVGPKPSVIIDFKGLEQERYYATLLSSTNSTGPYSALDRDGAYTHYQEGDEDYDIFLKFTQYKDADNFYFLQYFQDCSQTQQFSWTYYPPEEFKVLLYFPDSDSFVGSGHFERYAFDSYFTADASAGIPDNADLSVIKSYNYSGEALSLIARILLTIALEAGIALLFGFREKRQFRFIILVNVITQLALNITLNLINYYMGLLGFLIFYILLEILVFLVEAIIYAACLNKRSQKKVPAWKPWVYALAANTTSFVLGLCLAYVIPGIF